MDLTTFAGGVSVCDPQIKYDPQTSRWFYAALRCDGTKTLNRLYVGFSKTSDPTDLSIAKGHGWCGYEYNTEKALEDYPKLGLDLQHVILGTNSFNAETEEFVSAHVFAGPKPTGPIEGECPAEGPKLKQFGSPLETSVGNPAFTPEPATVADGSPSGFVVSADSGQESIMIWRVGGTASEPKLEALGAPKVPFFEVAPPVPQPGTTDHLDSLDPRFTQAVAAADPNVGGAEAVWTQHTIEGGGGSVVRWYEIVPSKVEVRQVGTISDPSKFVFNGAIAPTLTGGAVINYDTGSSTSFVQVMAQSRIGSAPLGTMNTPITLASSSARDGDFSCPSETGRPEPCRWGDYAGASVDPTNNNVVWGSNQINEPYAFGAAQWATQNFAVEPNDLPPSASFTIAPNSGTAGSPVGFNGAGSSDPDGSIASFSWNFGDGNAGSGAAPSHTYGAAGTYTVTLTVTDNGGETNATSHQVTVAPAPPPFVPPATTTIASTTATTTTTATTIVPPPNSTFSPIGATISQITGAITFTESVSEPGTFSWLLTFQNGKFGAFTSGNTKCKAGFVRLSGKCRPARIVFAKGRKTVTAAGTVSFTLKPSSSALKALRNALKQRNGLPVTTTLTFQSSLGGSPVSHSRLLTIKLKKR
ncbi:MAG: PKD domain-containing protein [Solirubrobacterales bacterium]